MFHFQNNQLTRIYFNRGATSMVHQLWTWIQLNVGKEKTDNNEIIRNGCSRFSILTLMENGE